MRDVLEFFIHKEKLTIAILTTINLLLIAIVVSHQQRDNWNTNGYNKSEVFLQLRHNSLENQVAGHSLQHSREFVISREW